MKYKSVIEMIGNTPVVEISNNVTGLKNIKVYAKCELYNPFGSLKDRAALAMFKAKEEELKTEGVNKIIEASSGNTAKALTVIGSINGYKFETVTNRIKIPETKDILKTLGAEIEELPGESECPDPINQDDPINYIKRKIASSDEKYFYPNQYENLNNPKIHFETTGPEIYNDLGNVDYFFGSLGTTGSSRGTIEYLISKNSKMKKIGIIGAKGQLLPGIRNIDEMLEVGIFNKNLYDDIVEVSEQNAIDSMLDLNRKIGILAGPTSGASLSGALEYLKKEDEKLNELNLIEGQEKIAVFIACDRIEPYMSYIKKRRPEIYQSNPNLDTIDNFENKIRLNQESFEYVKELETKEVNEIIENENPEGYIIIDLRGNMAYSTFYLKGSINITDYIFKNMLDNGLPFSKENKVLLVCANGEKSKIYAEYLNRKGMNIYSLKGGLVQYKLDGYSLFRKIKKLR